MHRILAVLIAFVLLDSSQAAADGGYKEFKWGMTYEEVHKLEPDIFATDSDGFCQVANAVFGYRYGDRYASGVPDVLGQFKHKIEAFDSTKNQRCFYFVDSQLACVCVRFLWSDSPGVKAELQRQGIIPTHSPLAALNQKYGVSPVKVLDLCELGPHNVAVWNSDITGLIIYALNLTVRRSMGLTVEEVSYLDPGLWAPFAQEFLRNNPPTPPAKKDDRLE